MRYALASALTLCALAAQALPQKTAARKIPCKTLEKASLCYWTHGRLSVYNGNPTWRLWKIGTKRILGIYSGPSRFPPRANEDSESPEFPSNLDRIYEAQYKRRAARKDLTANWPDSAYGDFEICPLEPERKGEMQAACIESAKVTFLERYFPRYGLR
jgi:hypothetical protein